jgi:hypothetical protein
LPSKRGAAESALILGAGFFSSGLPQPRLAAFWSLVVHVVYGGLLGAIAKPALSDRIKREAAERGGREAA